MGSQAQQARGEGVRGMSKAIKWKDGDGVVHRCASAEIIPGDSHTFLVWTLCGVDVPAGTGFTGGPAADCEKCATKP